MTEPVKTRRRWLWGLPLFLGLVIGGPIAWRFRPLNDMERRLVGRWADPEPTISHYIFRPDRTFAMIYPNEFQRTAELELALGAQGVWRCSGERMLLRFDDGNSAGFLETLKGLLRGILIRPEMRDDWTTLSFDPAGNAWIEGRRYERVPDAPVRDSDAARGD